MGTERVDFGTSCAQAKGRYVKSRPLGSPFGYRQEISPVPVVIMDGGGRWPENVKTVIGFIIVLLTRFRDRRER